MLATEIQCESLNKSVFIIGKSGSGKDTLLKEMVSNGATPIVSYTTRPMRDGEENGVDYNFVSHDEFQHLIESGALTEYRTYNTLVGGKKDTWWYGTPKLDQDKNYVGVVTPAGIIPFIDTYGPQNIDIIYMQVSDTIRHRRAMKRGSFDETEWARRVETDNKDFAPEVISDLEARLGRPVIVINNDEEKELI